MVNYDSQECWKAGQCFFKMLMFVSRHHFTNANVAVSERQFSIKTGKSSRLFGVERGLQNGP